MKILFCNITYLKNYTGITNEDMPNNGGAWVEKNKDAHEQWNFLNQNGYCYGFVMNKGEQFALERIDKDYSKAAVIEDVTEEGNRIVSFEYDKTGGKNLYAILDGKQIGITFTKEASV